MVHKGKKKTAKLEAKAELAQEVEEEKVKTSQIGEVASSKDDGKKGRIIVRNLPFKGLNDDVFKKHFKKFGTVTDVKLLRKNDGKFVGCGFIQYLLRKDAVKAIYHLNGTPFLGRQIIVDWALPKDTYINRIQGNMHGEKQSQKTNEDSVYGYEIDTKPTLENEVKEVLSQDGEDTQDQDDVEDEEDDDEDQDDDSEDYKEELDDTKPDKHETDSQIGSEKIKNESKDVLEGKTVFIKNIPFTITNEKLKECMSQFGNIYYALICVDKLTEHSKGTGFVKFKSKESADKCLEMSKKLYLEGNVLEIQPALSKENLADKKKPKERTDGRNLYLVKEGVVMAGTKAAVGVSASDMTKRLQVEQWKTQMLRNLNMFVARTRIVIHNLPLAYTDHKLRKMVLSNSKPGTVVKEARILRDRKVVDSKGVGASKQVGFVTFDSHENALWALRNINNNPMIFTPNKRPIVAFSIENREILNLKNKRAEKSKLKAGLTIKDLKLNKKQRRGIRRKEKKIEKFKTERKLKRDARLKETGTIEENISKPKPQKRKNMSNKSVLNKKIKLSDDVEVKEFAGITSVPGKVTKFLNRGKLKAQSELHFKTLKKEKSKRKKEMKKIITRQERMGKDRQKQNKNMKTDSNEKQFNKLITSYKEKIQKQFDAKKWYEN